MSGGTAPSRPKKEAVFEAPQFFFLLWPVVMLPVAVDTLLWVPSSAHPSRRESNCGEANRGEGSCSSTGFLAEMVKISSSSTKLTLLSLVSAQEILLSFHRWSVLASFMGRTGTTCECEGNTWISVVVAKSPVPLKLLRDDFMWFMEFVI
eukprot:CAMPEP_0115583300 /NCGR_PEP_ID=MMETSP0272-20121206/6101_1 /TAXON_ID=71861 /ORGANISM="Scrippsiella trochoidea, Strain CCMP3099" /LENGTH=149 /DNA_ID=CAMNT_0003018307 /DNA_START=79 /DNA_END=528 /DNA_ORIENTATION=-